MGFFRPEQALAREFAYFYRADRHNPQARSSVPKSIMRLHGRASLKVVSAPQAFFAILNPG
jgi:hypothetical protein